MFSQLEVIEQSINSGLTEVFFTDIQLALAADIDNITKKAEEVRDQLRKKLWASGLQNSVPKNDLIIG